MKKGTLVLIAGMVAMLLTGGSASAYWTNNLKMQCQMPVVYPVVIHVLEEPASSGTALVANPALDSFSPETAPQIKIKENQAAGSEDMPENSSSISSALEKENEENGGNAQAEDGADSDIVSGRNSLPNEI